MGKHLCCCVVLFGLFFFGVVLFLLCCCVARTSWAATHQPFTDSLWEMPARPHFAGHAASCACAQASWNSEFESPQISLSYPRECPSALGPRAVFVSFRNLCLYVLLGGLFRLSAPSLPTFGFALCRSWLSLICLPRKLRKRPHR